MVVPALLVLKVAVCGTTRKKAIDLPEDLLRIKDHNRLYL